MRRFVNTVPDDQRCFYEQKKSCHNWLDTFNVDNDDKVDNDDDGNEDGDDSYNNYDNCNAKRQYRQATLANTTSRLNGAASGNLANVHLDI